MSRSVILFYRLILLLMFSVLYAHASPIESGRDFLISQMSSGVFGVDRNNSSAITFDIQSARESVSALEALDEISQVDLSLVLPVFAQDNNQTESLASQMKVLNAFGMDVQDILQRLYMMQNDDGGWGHSACAQSDGLDTALALEVLYDTDRHNEHIANAVRFLTSRQSADGSWRDTQGDTLYTTATVLHALWLYRKDFDLSDSLTRAQRYLTEQKRPDGSYGGETYLSALVLRAVAPFEYDKSKLNDTISYLLAMQASNGGWENDVYVTVLVIQALLVADKEIPNPDLSSITGVVVDADTGVALSGVDITLSGESNETYTTGSEGMFVFDGLRNGAYTIDIVSGNYAPLRATLNLSGNDVDLGTLRLNKNVNATVSTLTGIVKNAQDGSPIADAKVQVGDKEILSDTSGHYTISNIEPGTYTVSVSKVGYLQNDRQVQIAANTLLRYDVELRTFDFTVKSDIVGKIIDANSSSSLQGVRVTLTDGNITKDYATSAAGTFEFKEISQGNYHLEIAKDGYYAVRTTFSIDSSHTIDFGIIALHPVDNTTPQFASVHGNVTDAITKRPLSDAQIEVSGMTAQSEADGTYNIENVPVGDIEIHVSKDGYKSVSATGTLTPGSTLIFSPSLQKDDGVLKLFGTIVDANSSEPLQDVNVTIADTNLSAFTDSNGSYVISGIPKGDITIEVSRFGYRSIKIGTTVEDKNIEFSPALQRYGSVNGTTTLSGNVEDVVSKETLEGVRFYVNGIDTGVRSDIDGNFTIEGIATYDINLTLQKDGYKDVNTYILLSDFQNVNIGTLHMRAENVNDFKPDLVVESINTAGVTSDIYTLRTIGELNITIANRGTVPANPFEMVVFFDSNADGNYTEDKDKRILSHSVSDSIDIGSSYEVALEINATSDFRDQPIYVYIDSKNENIESDENNTYSTAKSCGGKQGQIDLGICFDYSGSVSSYMHIQKNGLVLALRDPLKFPRDGSIRLTVWTGQGNGREYLEPTIITEANADSVADQLENTYFSGYDYMGNCLKTIAEKWESLNDKSTYRAVTLSGDGIWGPSYRNTTSYATDREYAVAHGVNVIDTIGIGSTYKQGLEAFVYPQPAGGDFGKVYYAKTSEDISNSIITTFKKQTQIADLTLGKLNIIDNGTDNNISIAFTVGNAGVATIPSDINISVYEGDPTNGGVLLATAKLDQNLSFGQLRIIRMDDIPLQEGGEIYVVGDDENRLVECTKNNNIISSIVSATSTLGDIDVQTDKLSYTANEKVLLSAQITNPGKLSYDLTAQLILEDIEGNVIQAFDKQALGAVLSKESKNISDEWNTTTTLAGRYVVHGILTDTNGNIVNEDRSTFRIVSSAGGHTDASVDLRLDKAVYHTTDTVHLDQFVRSLSVNGIIENAKIDLAVTNEANVTIHTQTVHVGTLLPETVRELNDIYAFDGLDEGNYTVKAILTDDNNVSYDTDVRHFEVRRSLPSVIKGTVAVAWREGYIGNDQLCRYSIGNFGASDMQDVPVVLKIIDMQNGSTKATFDTSEHLAAKHTLEDTKTLSTRGYREGTYSCGLYVQQQGQWVLLDHRLFTLKRLYVPKAYNDYHTVSTGKSAVIDVLSNDAALQQDLDLATMRLVDAQGKASKVLQVPGEGTWSILSDGKIRFTPQQGYIGDPAPVRYRIEDVSGAVLSALVYVNYPPVAHNDSAKVSFGKSVSIAVLRNDRRAGAALDGDGIRLIDTQGQTRQSASKAKETLVISTPKGFWQVDKHHGTIKYTPKKNVSGTDSVRYVVYDRSGDRSNEATVTVRISASNAGNPYACACGCACGCQQPPFGQTNGTAEQAEEDAGKATIYWKDVAGEIGYMIYRNGELIAIVDEGVTTYEVEGLEPDTTYTFKVVSFDGYGHHVTQTATLKTKAGYGWYPAMLHLFLDK